MALAEKLSWSELDKKAVDTARLLAADAVQKVGNGHPGTAMSLAPAAYLLFNKVMRHNPLNANWLGRDRFILSPGHSALTLYTQLFYSGYGLELHDLESLRTWDSKTPGHPEYSQGPRLPGHRHTPGIEMTTGPLGQGLATAVGFAYGGRYLRGLLDPESPVNESIFDHMVYVIASDGDLEEGVTSEASSLAGLQQLGNLVVIYDDNKISIEDDTNVAFCEDVLKRYESYGWHTQKIDWANGSEYVEDVDALYQALRMAEKDSRPSLIALSTIIGWPAPNLKNTAKAHGSALGAAEVAETKKFLGFDPDASFAVDDEVLAHTRKTKERGAAIQHQWDRDFADWERRCPEKAALLDRLIHHKLPEGIEDALPAFKPGKMSTRVASGKVINAFAPLLPELWGGSADLASSTNTTIENVPSFIPSARQSKQWQADIYGRVLHFGIREHAAAAIVNGIVTSTPTRAFTGTFLVFSDYQRPAIRLSALMGIPSIYIWTHDSIGLGEDGPTHQPVEHLASLRAIPNFDVIRPADANETAAVWKTVLERAKPSGIVLSRQDLTVFDRKNADETGTVCADADNAAYGGYILLEAKNGNPDVVIIATGSEVQIAVQARSMLESEGTATRVVSMPSLEWFGEQPEEYRDKVLPPKVKARVSVEAGLSLSWNSIVGDAGRSVSLEHYGASADYVTLYDKFGITPEAVVTAARRSLADAKAVTQLPC